jgi:hypothetical protein
LAVPNSNFDQLTAITNDFFMPTMPDLVFDANPVLSMLHAKGTKPQGGSKIRLPHIYQMSQDGAYFDYAKGSTSAEDQVSAAEYNWKLYRQRVVISVPEINRNDGPEGIYKLLKAKMDTAATAIRSVMADDMYDETGTDAGAAINGLPNILGDGTVPGAVTGSVTSGGISKSAQSYWAGIGLDTAASTWGTMAEMETLWFNTIDGNIHPDMIVSHPTAVKTHQAEVTGYSSAANAERFVNTNMLNSGFTTYTFQGQPWYMDRHCSTGNTNETVGLYMLNTKYIDLVSHKNENFRFSGFMTPTDQNVRIGWIYWMGNIVSIDPSRSGILYETA